MNVKAIEGKVKVCLTLENLDYDVSGLFSARVRQGVESYLSKRLRRQGQTEGALTNTKVLLVSA